MFEGMCLTTTALSVLFLCCPPFPDPLQVEISKSLGFNLNSFSVGSFKTATVIVLVWTRPNLSVGDIRCHLCPPDSFSNNFSTPIPKTLIIQRPGISSIILNSKTPPLTQAGINVHLFQH